MGGRREERRDKRHVCVFHRLIDAGCLHDSEELLDVDDTVVVLVELVDHGLELVVAQRLAQLARHTAEVLQRYRAGLVVVEQGEGLADLLLGIAIGNLEQKNNSNTITRGWGW